MTDNGNIQDNQVQKVSEVWELDAFPSVTKPIGCSPKQLLEGLISYANSRFNVEDMCADLQINLHTFYGLCRNYPEIEQFYRSAQKVRAEYLADEATSIADDTSGDIIKQTRSNGDIFYAPNMANVRRSELRIKHRQWLMERYNPDKYGQRTKVEQTSRSLHIHGHVQLPPVTELDSIGLDGLMNVQKSIRYGDGTTQQSGATRR